MMDIVRKNGDNIDTGKLGFRISGKHTPGFNVEDEHFDFQTDLFYASGGSVIPSYRGPYVVIPKSYQQGLDTNGLKMLDDVTVEQIPYSRVSNPSGGDTVNIGG